MTNCSTFWEYAARLRELIHSSDAGCHEFNELALELFALQFAHNAPYRRFCQARGAAPESIADWTRIPAIPTSAFKYLELTSVPVNERTVVFHSSGTTEQRPSRHFHTVESLAIYEASLLTWFAACVLKDPPSTRATKLGDQRSPSPPRETAPNFLRALRPGTTEAFGPSSLASRQRSEERAGEWRDFFPGLPLSPALSPLVPHGERETPLASQPPVHGQGESSSACNRFNSRFRILSLTPSPTDAPHSSLVHMFETIRRELGSAGSGFIGHVANGGAWALEVDGVIASLGRSRRREEADSGDLPPGPPPHVGGYDLPVVLLGTAFSFVHLLDFLVGKNLRLKLPPGSRVLETGGYKGRSRELPKAELHALISERLGIPPSHIVCEYGMSELSSQAYERMSGREANAQRSTLNAQPCFHFPPWARAKIISPETGREVAEGETGLIRVFDLANVYSVMAIQTEDLGIRRGDGFELIGRAKAVESRGCSLMTH